MALAVAVTAVCALVLVLARLWRRLEAAERLAERQRQELSHASRLAIVGELTASIAHEINQPLGAILSNADAGEILLGRPSPPLAEIRRILVDIRRDGLRASGVIRDVRALVRRREPDLHLLDADTLVADTVQLLDAETRRRRLAVITVPSPRPLSLRGDPALLQQVLINLLLNAMDATEALGPGVGGATLRPPIEIGVDGTPESGVRIRVVDSGVGIRDARMDQLFDSFHTSKPHGMGLGLSIARSIVEGHGGRIEAGNNAGSGATFVVMLPAAVEPPATSTVDPA